MHHLKNGRPNPVEVPPHQLVKRILSTVLTEEFDELFVGRVDHFGDCLFTRVEYSGRSVSFFVGCDQRSEFEMWCAGAGNCWSQ
jgi:hypothetical protein